MKKAIATLCLGALLVPAAFAACSSQHASAPPGDQTGGEVGSTGLPPSTSDTGSVGSSLLIGPGVTLTALTWTIGNGAHSYTGVVHIGDAQSVEWVSGGIIAGSGYSLSVAGADSNGDPCVGSTSSTFTVTAGGLTQVGLAVFCTAPSDGSLPADVGTGSVAVDAGVVVVNQPPIQCPGVTSMSANPAELAPGQPTQLGEMTTAAASIRWTVSPPSGGTFLNPADGGTGADLPSPNFVCSTPNTQVTLTVTAGLPDSGVCTGVAFTSMSALINCEPACNVATDCPGTDTACAFRTCVAGACGTAVAPEGTSCDATGDICNGAGACVPFTVDVVRLGTGDGGTLTTAAAPVFLQRRLVSDGGIVGTPTLLPTATDGGQDICSMPGIALIAGLSRSQDGHYLTMVGYNAPLGSTNPANSADTIVVARVDSSGHVDTSTQFATSPQAFLSLNSLRSSVTADGTSFWVGGVGGTVDGGSTGGIWSIPFGGVAPGRQLSTVPTRLLGINGGQLYGSGDTDAGEVFALGSGLPTSGSPAATTLNGLPTITANSASPWQFVFLQMAASGSTPDTLYVANDRAVGAGPSGIQRFSLSGGVWTQTANLTLTAADGGAPVGFRGVVGVKTGPSAVTLVATSVEVPTRIAVFTDDGVSNPWNGTSRIIAVANAGQEFYRGIALSPHP